METVALGLLVLMHVHVCVTMCFFVFIFSSALSWKSHLQRCIQCIHMYILTNAWIFMKVIETDSSFNHEKGSGLFSD